MTLRVTNKSVSIGLSNLSLSGLVIFFIALFISESTIARDNPGWGNAALVCETPRIGGDSPDLNFKGTKPSFITGFYHIGRLPDSRDRYLGVENDNSETVALLPSATHPPAKWLITQVGADLYQISTCHHGVPRCLALSNLGKHLTARLDQCDHEAYGAQVWWNIGILFGPGKGGWALGNDGVGRMECLTETSDNGVPYLAPCDTTGKPAVTWRVEPVSSSQPDVFLPKDLKQSNESSLSNFPDGADVISYQCDSGQHVETFYDSDNDVMKVRYQNEFLVLHPVISGSGAKFGGINKPWGWWTKGNEGFIFSNLTDATEGDLIEVCREADFQTFAPQNTNGPIWYLSEYFDQQKNKQINSLIFGIPETDAYALIAHCNRELNTVDVDFSLNTENLKLGSPYFIRLQTADFDQTYIGQVFSENSEYAGVRLTLPDINQFSMALEQGETVYIIPQIGEEFQLSHPESMKVAQSWMASCAHE